MNVDFDYTWLLPCGKITVKWPAGTKAPVGSWERTPGNNAHIKVEEASVAFGGKLIKIELHSDLLSVLGTIE